MATRTGKGLRLRKRELFRLLGYTPHEFQASVHRSRARYRLVCCGTRGGKSMLAAYESLAALLEPRPSALGWVVAPTLDVTEHVFGRVLAALTGHMPHRVIEADRRHHLVSVRNLGGGVSVLRARSADNPAALLGSSLDFAVVDEACRVRDHVWFEHISPRLVDRQGWLLAISTPASEGWFRTLYEKGLRGDADCESWNWATSANPAIEAEWIAGEEQRLPADVFDELYLAKFRRDRGYDECQECGGITRESRASGGYYGALDVPMPTCSACGFPLDERGMAVGWVTPSGRPEPGKMLWLTPTPETDAWIAKWKAEPELRAEAARLPMLHVTAGLGRRR